MDVFALFISPTGNTAQVARAIASGIASKVSGNDFFSIDLTSWDSRDGVYEFGPDDTVIIGLPTYAGRIPNKLLPYFKESIYGNNTTGISVVTYGNRAYDDSLKELYDIMTDNSFCVTAAVAAPCEHAFSDKLANGRPTEEDLRLLRTYGERIGTDIINGKIRPLKPSDIPGRNAGEMKYYTPLTENGDPASFLKAMPITDSSECINCGNCREICPMNCYKSDVTIPEGICIKCHGCVNNCPVHAKHFDDADLLSHIKYLEREYADTKHDIEAFISSDV